LPAESRTATEIICLMHIQPHILYADCYQA
jgi:hypothetical protein